MAKSPEQTVRLVPPLEMFEGASLEPMYTHETPANQVNTPTYHIHTPEEGGVLSFRVGDKHPVKGWPFREAVFAADTLKRAALNIAKFLISSPVRYFTALFLFLPVSWQRRMLRKAVSEFVDFAAIVFDRWGRVMEFFDRDGKSFGIQGVVWKSNYYCDMVREVRRVGMQMAGNDIDTQRLVETICMVLEFDDGYRYRIQDLIGCLDVAAFLANPAREATRVLHIGVARGEGTKAKFQTVAKAVPILLRIKPLRQALTEFFKRADLQRLCLDDIDRYRCFVWAGWDFDGIPLQQRLSARMMIDTEWQYREKGRQPSFKPA